MIIGKLKLDIVFTQVGTMYGLVLLFFRKLFLFLSKIIVCSTDKMALNDHVLILQIDN